MSIYQHSQRIQLCNIYQFRNIKIYQHTQYIKIRKIYQNTQHIKMHKINQGNWNIKIYTCIKYINVAETSRKYNMSSQPEHHTVWS